MSRTKTPSLPSGRSGDVSYVTNTIHDAVQRMREPESDAVVQERHIRQQVSNAQQQALVERDRSEAEEVGMPYALYATLTDVQRKAVHDYASKKGAAQAEREWGQDKTYAPIRLTEADEGRLTDQRAFEAVKRALITKSDRKSHTLLCDPPVELEIDGEVQLFHPGVSKIPHKLRDKKIEKRGFTSDPLYPFLPPPTLPCEFNAISIGTARVVGCSYLGRTEDEVDTHARRKHPQEVAARESREAREKARIDRENHAMQMEERQAALEQLRINNELKKVELERTAVVVG
jgi:hypothetical protein